MSLYYKTLIRYSFIFLFFLIIFSLIQFSSSNFISSDDGYYHIKHSWLYLKEGFNSAYNFSHLQFSTLKDKPVDIYFLYHLLLSPFTYFFNGQNYQSLIDGSKFFHSILASLFFVIFYFVFKGLENQSLHFKSQKSEFLDFIWLIFLFSASYFFIFRLLMPRPHTISIIFMLLGFYFIVKKKYFFLFILSVFYVLFYSLSFLILVLSFIYFLANYFYFKGKNLFSYFLPFLISLLGILLGLLIRPYPLNYLYNAYFIPLAVIFYRFFGIGKLYLGGELYDLNLEPQTIIIFGPFFIFSFTYFFYIFENKKEWRNIISAEKFFLFWLVIFLFILAFFVKRAIEYFIPFAALFLILMAKEDLSLFLKELILKIKEIDFGKSCYSNYSNFEKKIFNFLILKIEAIIKIISFLFLFFIFYFSIFNIIRATNLIRESQSYEDFKKAAQFIAQNSKPKELVFNAIWGDFPLLFFFNDYNYYLIGMDPTFMYFKDRQKYWQWFHLSHNGFSCPKFKCGQDEREDIYKVLKDQFNARYIFLNGNFNKKLKITLDNDDRFKKAFHISDIFVYSFE